MVASEEKAPQTKQAQGRPLQASSRLQDFLKKWKKINGLSGVFNYYNFVNDFEYVLEHVMLVESYLIVSEDSNLDGLIRDADKYGWKSLAKSLQTLRKSIEGTYKLQKEIYADLMKVDAVVKREGVGKH